ncbi:hypothetical protein JNUCC64_17565 [Streptomyces sp. JNUCC 64]
MASTPRTDRDLPPTVREFPSTARELPSLIPPLVSTLVTVPGALLAWFFVGLSPMACGSCEGGVLERFDRDFAFAYTLFGYGMLLPAASLVAAWALPWRDRFAAARLLCATAAPFLVGGLTLAFHLLVDWP